MSVTEEPQPAAQSGVGRRGLDFGQGQGLAGAPPWEELHLGLISWERPLDSAAQITSSSFFPRTRHSQGVEATHPPPAPARAGSAPNPTGGLFSCCKRVKGAPELHSASVRGKDLVPRSGS